MVLQKKPIYSALYLVLCFFSIAGFYFLLHSVFLAVMQIIIYAGAVLVFILFVIMLLGLKEREFPPILRFQRPLALVFSFVLLVLLTGGGLHALSAKMMAPGTAVPDAFGSVRLFGKLLFSKYLLPFELASIILLIAMIGAAVLGKKKETGREGTK
jgi:NADH-quinone oxidoreductase subunit J